MVAKCTQRGMTLVELLVIMAIVTIVVTMIISNGPGGCGFDGKPVRAVSEINSIELALTKMLSDVGETSARSFFDETAFNAARDDLQRAKKLNAFEASVEIYSTALTGLMWHGKNAPAQQGVFAETLNTDVVGRLGLSYDESIGLDPWGIPYRFFPGPWPEAMGPMLLRTFLVPPQEAWYPGDNAPPQTRHPDARAYPLPGNKLRLSRTIQEGSIHLVLRRKHHLRPTHLRSNAPIHRTGKPALRPAAGTGAHGRRRRHQ